MVDLSRYSKYPKILRNHKFSSFRITSATDAEDITRTSYQAYLSDKACNVYVSTPDVNNPNFDPNNPIKEVVKIFTDPSLDVKKGDKIVAVKNGKTYKGYASKPIPRSLGLCFELLAKGDA